MQVPSKADEAPVAERPDLYASAEQELFSLIALTARAKRELATRLDSRLTPGYLPVLGMILRSQRITVRAGATWESASSHRYVYPGLIRDETNSLDGGTYTFDAASGALVLGSTNSVTVLVGTVSGRRLTIMKEGDRLTYER